MASDKSRVTKRILDYFQEKMKEWTLQNAGGSSVTEDRVLGIEADIEALETSMDDMDGAISGEGGLTERVQALEDAGTGGGDVTLEDLGITVSADSINKIDDIQNDLIPVMDELYYPYANNKKSLVYTKEMSVKTGTDYTTYLNKSTYKIIGISVHSGYSAIPCTCVAYYSDMDDYIHVKATRTDGGTDEWTTVTIIYST